MNPSTTPRWPVLALAIVPSLALLAAYAVEHAWLCDDAFISFRYARNLVNGHGLVFNVGERVEGYTNFLWVLELAAVWKLFGVAPEHSSYALSALYTIGTLYVSARLAWDTRWTEHRWVAVAITLGLLAINRNIAVWTTSGLETRQFTFFVLLAIWLLQRETTSDTWRTFVPASLAWSLAELTRPEAALLFGCGGLWLLGRQAMDKQWRWRALVGYGAPFLIIVGTHYLWRHAYYGDWFPNTYYAKDVRAWPEAGFSYLTQAVIEGGVQLALPLCALGLCMRLSVAREGLHTLSALCIVLHAAYLIRIGGDHFELRPLDFYWPLLAIATADGLLCVQRWVQQWLHDRSAAHAISASWYATAVVGLVVAVYGTALQLAHLTITHDLKTRQETFKLNAAISPATFPAVFLLPGMQGLVDLYNAASRFGAEHFVGLRHAEHRVFWRQQWEKYAPYLGHVDDVFPADAVMQLDSVGVAGYALDRLTIIDTLGLTDRTVAHNPVWVRNGDRRLAHDRFPPPGYLESRGVNVEVLGAETSFGPDTEYALRLTDTLWMPLRSEKPDWLRAAFRSRGLWWKQLRGTLKRNEVWAEGKALTPVRALGFFDDGTLQEWVAKGAAMADQPRTRMTRGQQGAIGMVGTRFINTFHVISGDRAKGSLASPPFVPEAGEHLVFLVGGGRTKRVGVELRVDDKVVATWRGNDSEALALVVQALDAYVGRACQVHVVDQSAGTWGHVLADHFMLMRPL